MKTLPKLPLVYLIIGLALLGVYGALLGGLPNALMNAWQHLLEDYEQLDVHLFIAGVILTAYGGIRLIWIESQRGLRRPS
ncbi:MAG: hypothetical protein HYU39_09870 [Thaumarchaeota archaeon]|nr:hypothetical protein [Nitrososphaerota archaeon]